MTSLRSCLAVRGPREAKATETKQEEEATKKEEEDGNNRLNRKVSVICLCGLQPPPRR